MEEVLETGARGRASRPGADAALLRAARRDPRRRGRQGQTPADGGAGRAVRTRPSRAPARRAAPGLRPCRRLPPPARSARRRADKVDRLLDAVGETALHRRRLEHLLGAAGARCRPAPARGARARRRLLGRAAGRGAADAHAAAGLDRRDVPRAVRDIAPTAGREVRLELTAPRRRWTGRSSTASPRRSCTCCATPSPTASSRPTSASRPASRATGRSSSAPRGAAAWSR